MQRFGWIVLAAFATAFDTGSARAGERFGLLIGNQAYHAKVGPLRNPHNDIAVVGNALAEVGFKLLTPRKDATRDEMLFAVHELASQMRAAGRDAVSFLYYAGHGVGIGMENVLIPTNAVSTTDAMLSVRGVRLSEILDILKRGAPEAVHFVVLDACRNALHGQRGPRGFVPVTDRRLGVVIAFSTGQGETATDEGAKSTPYAAALADEIIKPGRNDQAVFNAVRERVVRDTGGQTPWTHDGLVGARVIFKAMVQPVAPESTAAAVASSVSAALESVRICREVESMHSMSLLDVLASQHRETPAGGCIVARIEELKRGEAARKKAEDDARSKAELERQGHALLQQPADEDSKRPQAEAKRETEWKRPDVARPVVPGSGQGFRDRFVNGQLCPMCPEMVVVPEGEFLMGSATAEIAAVSGERPDLAEHFNWEAPQRKVRIARPFAVGRTHVTRGEFAAFAAATGHATQQGCFVHDGNRWHLDGARSWRSPGFDQTDRHPVVCVSWAAANAYADWLSKVTGHAYRLPSEAEVEYGTRSTTRATELPRYFFGNDAKDLCAYGNIANLSAAAVLGWQRDQVALCDDGYMHTAPVGSFKANAWGLRDMHGNAWTWTADCWNDTHTGAALDGTARTVGDCSRRVVRGGAWSNGPRDVRAAVRDSNSADDRSGNLGFRLARALDP